MVSDIIQKQVEGILEQDSKRLQELSIFILLLTVAYFVHFWFGPLWQFIPFKQNLPDASRIAIEFFISTLIFTLAFLIFIVAYLWWLRNKPRFHVLFIERLQERRQIDTKRFVALLLIPTSISVGLASSVIVFSELPFIFPAIKDLPFWAPFIRSFGPYDFIDKAGGFVGSPPVLPLIIAVCLFTFLYFAYRIKPERVQRSLPWLLFIPIIASIFLLLYQISANLNLTFDVVFSGTAELSQIDYLAQVATAFSGFALFLSSFIVLLYLTCRHIDAEHRKSYTLAKERHLQGFIEEGVGILPERVRVGDSHNISLDLTLSKSYILFNFIAKNFLEDYLSKSNDYLEAELQAAELKVDSEKRMSICETSLLPITGWNCSFPNSGTHTINLMINVIRHDNSRSLIFTHAHDVKVSSLLSIALLPVLTLVIPILAAVIQALLKR